MWHLVLVKGVGVGGGWREAPHAALRRREGLGVAVGVC